MLSLAERVYRTVLRHSLLPPGARVIVALSGGADSTALACLLAELSPIAGFGFVGAAHLNHRLRGAAADEDELFCERLASRLGVAWRVARQEVAAVAASARLSVEEASRECRYAFLAQAALELEATHVAVGHTRDDQAETLLLQLFRGAGPRGLAAMASARRLGRLEPGDAGHDRPWLVRPLLEVGHHELVEWLGQRGIGFREDASNADRRYLRNRVRHDVIPFLDTQLARPVSKILARDAAIAASDAECLEALAQAAFERLAVVAPDRVQLDGRALLGEPQAIARRVVLLALAALDAGRLAGFDQVARVLALAGQRERGPVSLPGVVALYESDNALVLSRAARSRPRGNEAAPAGRSNFWRCALSIPGEAVVGGWVVSSFVCPLSDRRPAELVQSAREAVLDRSAVGDGLLVRTRRPGDRLKPLGLGGRTKKLQDYLVDRKVPRAERDEVPIVVDANDRIVWVAGHGIDEDYRVSEGTRDVVILKLRGESA